MAKSGSSAQTSLPLDLGGNGLASAKPVSVRLTGGKPARALTRNQKQFAKLLKEVETLRARHDRVTATWERFLGAYQKHIHPEEQRQHDLRKQAVRLLGANWRAPKGLGPRQRDALADLIESQLNVVLDHEPDLADAELLALRKDFAKRAATRRAAQRDDESTDDDHDDAEYAHLPPHLVKMIRDAGLDPRPFHVDMTQDELVAEMQRQILENDIVFESDFAADFDEPPPESKRGSSRRATAPADPRRDAEQAEAARKRTISVIYKQLAKILHPDRETDPVEREKKHHLMQELTNAYQQGDLHTLLRLELAWIHREEGDLDRLTDEKLKIYIELLNEQVGDLHKQVAGISYSPRFAAVGRFANRFTGEPERVEEILADLRPYTDSLRHTVEGLQSEHPREHLRTILRDYIHQQKSRALF